MSPVLDDFRALNDPERRRRVERSGGYFVVEGTFAVEELLRSRYPVRALLASARKEAAVRALVAASPRPDAPVLVLPQDELTGLAGFAFHRGVLASADRLALPAAEDLVRDATRVAVLEGLTDHENLGALFRNAAAFGIDAVLLDATTADPLYRRSVRVSVGHVLHVPWTRTDDWPGVLRANGFTTVALTPDPQARPIDDLAASPPARVAFLLGTEGPGLSQDARTRADVEARIPISPRVDSLNVATAAAIAFHRL
jgi:tRNA G18 (ribose-2'-O)-methylase SpoU